MAESEGGGSEGVENGGVDLGVVLVVVAVGDGEDVQLRHVVGAEDQGQPLVVSDVLRVSVSIYKTRRNHNNYLILGYDDLPGLLVQPLVVPVGVEVGELLGESVVFPDPDRVVDSEAGLLVTPAVPCNVDQEVVPSLRCGVETDLL